MLVLNFHSNTKMSEWFGSIMKCMIVAICLFILALMIIYVYRKSRDAFNNVDADNRAHNWRRQEKRDETTQNLLNTAATTTANLVDKSGDTIVKAAADMIKED